MPPANEVIERRLRLDPGDDGADDGKADADDHGDEDGFHGIVSRSFGVTTGRGERYEHLLTRRKSQRRLRETLRLTWTHS